MLICLLGVPFALDMSQRAVWVLSLGAEGGKQLFSRTFPTVEMRAKQADSGQHVPLPSPGEFVSSFTEALGLTTGSSEFNSARDSCVSHDEKPVFEVSTPNGKLWPLLVMEHNALLFCCLPFVEDGAAKRPPLIKIPGIAMGYTLLQGMADFLGAVPRNIEPTNEKFADLYLYLGEAAPFGRPIDVNTSNIKAIFQIKSKKGGEVRLKDKQPAWRPNVYKGKPSLHFKVTEQIQACQYDSPSIPDVWQVSGTVKCKAELEGLMPDVSVIIGYRNETVGTQMDHLVTHPCVQSADSQIIETVRGLSTRPMPRKLRFTPPLETITLCHYTANSLPDLPIKGVYQMKGEKFVECLVQLKLSEQVKNSFEYCELQVPFFHRGPIQKVDSSPSHGSVLLSRDKKMLVWNIGQKFPSKAGDILLNATLHFGHYDPKKHPNDDPFCVANNSYIQIFFKIIDFTHSGVQIDNKSAQVSSTANCKITTEHEYVAKDYRIWNTHGDSLHAFAPPKDLLSQKD